MDMQVIGMFIIIPSVFLSGLFFLLFSIYMKPSEMAKSLCGTFETDVWRIRTEKTLNHPGADFITDEGVLKNENKNITLNISFDILFKNGFEDRISNISVVAVFLSEKDEKYITNYIRKKHIVEKLKFSGSREYFDLKG